MSFERSNIHAMQGYVPGEQPDEGDVIKLNTNENPYPAPPAVASVLSTIKVEDLRRYPPPTALDFRRAAARLHGLGPENVIPTNGGDELLRLAITTFANPGESVGIAVPGYSLYPVLTEIQACKLVSVPLDESWHLPADFAEQLNAAKARLAMLVNPHAPSGILTPVSRIAEIAGKFKGVLLVDEAYVDFVDADQHHDLVPLLRQYPNLLLLRTLSKGYSLAGLRFAYGLGCADLIAPIMFKTRDSYNTDLIAQRLATAAINAAADASKSWDKVRSERQSLCRELEKLQLTVIPSQSNFVLVTFARQHDAKSIYLALKQRRILVRYFDQERLRDKLRISIGTAEQNRLLLQNLREIMLL
ncbi:MAG: histidinol-phosphate transaminase [Pseudohongiellaceae bacterium]